MSGHQFRPKAQYRFSYQQITGINYHFSKIANGTFEEDDVRLLLIHLREFLLNPDNISVTSQANARILTELGNSIAHTIRDRGEMYDRIKTLVRQFASAHRGGNWSNIPFTLFDAEKIIDDLKSFLIGCGVIYRPTEIEPAFQSNRVDLQLCLVCMLHGLVFKVKYPESSTDFYVTEAAKEHFINIRTEVDTSSLSEICLYARIPVYGGGKFLQRILRCELHTKGKIETKALHRTASPEGYCESVKALRKGKTLVITRIDPGVESVVVFDVLRAFSFDTDPISQGVELDKISHPLPNSSLPN